MTELTIREILDLVPRGQIRIPAFQRGFVWDMYMVAFLMDSLYKSYPIGSLLLWRTREQMKHERRLGPFELLERDPDYPIDYVLDGQQRLTSIFGVFQSELEPDDTVEWTDIYFDLAADPDAQESQFLALEPGMVDPRRHFPLKTLFLSVDYRRATQNFGDQDLKRLDEMQAHFKEARIPIQLLTTEDRAKVAIVFERVNRTGVPLDTLQLLTAWTWSEDFDLQHQFEELREELEPFGFAGIGEDSNLLLRCCAAVLAKDASPRTLVELNGAEVRTRFSEIVNGVKGAIDFLKSCIRAETLDNLPFTTILVPLSVFFSSPGDEIVKMSDHQRTRLVRWFWRACFSRRYSSGVLRNMKEDIDGMIALKEGRASTLGEFQILITNEFFLNSTFRINTVNTKTFVLFLAQFSPLTFISGTPVSLSEVLRRYNRSEFHHLFPRSFLSNQGYETREQNPLANFCFLSKSDNIQLGGVAPSEYKEKIKGDTNQILEHALCPLSLFDDDYEKFLQERSLLLEKKANELL
ncbi:MAG: DUF262 domain-containing protein [Gammaproteobacteria bacterium]